MSRQKKKMNRQKIAWTKKCTDEKMHMHKQNICTVQKYVDEKLRYKK